MQHKKRILALAVLMVVLCWPVIAHADVGPKPTITIDAVNMPPGSYMDLLAEGAADERGNEYFDEEDYDGAMLAALRAGTPEGWHSKTLDDATIPGMSGSIVCDVDQNGRCTMVFGYYPPSYFRIAVVSPDGRVSVSEPLERNTFDTVIRFDFETSRATVNHIAPWGSAALRLLATLLIEGALLLLFRFPLRENWKPFLIINACTQVTLHVLITLTLMAAGGLMAMLAYMLLEIVILIVETVLFVKFLKGRGKGWRVAYGVTANAVSFFAGLMLLARAMS